MLSEAQPCLQLLRIGPAPPYNPTRDLYTLLPAGQRCVFRLGRRPDLSDVCLGYGSGGGGGGDEEGGSGEDLISRLHAELEAERGAEGDWTVHMVDRSTNGTFVNDIRIPKGRRTELADGDTVTFGHPDATNIPEGSLASQQDSEFYFLFQKVTVRPADFDAITTPKVQNPCAFRPVSHADNCISPRGARIRDFTKAPPTSRATLILDSIGSISKLKSQLLTFHPARRHSDPEEGRKGLPTAEGVEWNSGGWAGQGPKRPCDRRETKHRRKAVHRVLPDLEEEIQRFSVEVEQSAAKLRHHKSESDADHRLYRQLTLGVEGREGQGLLSGLKPPLKRRKSEHSERSKRVDDNSGNGNGGDDKLVVRVSTGNTQVTPTGKKRGRPRKHPLGDMSLGPKVMCKVFTRTLYTAEQCAAERCQLPQEDTVEWVQCDDCDNWYHVACAGCNYTAVKEASAEFHCGCT